MHFNQVIHRYLYIAKAWWIALVHLEMGCWRCEPLSSSDIFSGVSKWGGGGAYASYLRGQSGDFVQLGKN